MTTAVQAPHVFRLVVVGSGGVGKSALTLRLIHGEFVDEYDPTIEDSYRKQCSVDGRVAILDILDTAGQAEYACMRDQYMRNGQGFVMVFSLTDRASFDEAQLMYEQLMRVWECDHAEGDLPPVSLVGNKCDMPEDREVPAEEAAQFAKSIGGKYFESSAKSWENVEAPYFETVRAIRKSMRRSSNAGSSSSKRKKPKQKLGKNACTIL
jgi:GTPase KRas